MVQLQVLNKILTTKDFSLIKINNFDASYFSTYKDEFKFIRNHYEKYGNVPDKETFVQQFPDFDFIDVADSDRYLVDALVEDKNTHVLAETFNKVREAVSNNNVGLAMSIYTESMQKLQKAKVLEAEIVSSPNSSNSLFHLNTFSFKRSISLLKDLISSQFLTHSL